MDGKESYLGEFVPKSKLSAAVTALAGKLVAKPLAGYEYDTCRFAAALECPDGTLKWVSKAGTQEIAFRLLLNEYISGAFGVSQPEVLGMSDEEALRYLA